MSDDQVLAKTARAIAGAKAMLSVFGERDDPGNRYDHVTDCRVYLDRATRSLEREQDRIARLQAKALEASDHG